jgi:hypothetical protein
MRISSLRDSETAILVMLTLAFAGCGGSSGGSSSGATATTYTVGGTVVGLENNAAVEVLSGSESLTLKSNGSFTLPTAGISGASYSVTVGTAPTGQSCAQLNGVGAIATADVTNILVFCTYNVSAATLTGSFGIAAFNVNAATDQLYSDVPFNGNGTLGASTVITNQTGTTFSTSTGSGGAYTVTTVDALPVLTVEGNNIGAIAGVDGDEFYWLENAVNTGGNGPGLAVGVNPLQTATVSSLAGNWTTVALTGATTPYASEASIAINADGSFSGNQTTLDVTGAASTLAVSGAAGSYTVTNDVVSIGGDSGYVSANSEFAVLTPVTQQPGGPSANYPGLTAAVKQGSGVTLATLNGVYSIGSLAFATATTGDGETITLYLDGAGDFYGTATENDNGTSSSSTTFAGTYSVTSTGDLTLTDSNGIVYTGAVSADGNIVVAATITPNGTVPPRILVGFRQ